MVKVPTAQRKSYSRQKKQHLVRPFTVCTAAGCVVEISGPYTANLNDAEIMEHVLGYSAGLGGFLEPSDICYGDRGFRPGIRNFRDVGGLLEQKGFIVRMHSLKGNREGLNIDETNHSRFVARIRWTVKAVNGIISKSTDFWITESITTVFRESEF